MRTFEEIKNEFYRAKEINDAEALHGYANELDGLNSTQARALASDARGWALYLTGDYAEALVQYHQASVLYEELGDRKGVASATGNLGSIYCGIAEYSTALEYQHRSLALYEELGDDKGMAANLGNLGITHRELGDYPAALEYYHRAMALHKERGDRGGEATIIGNIGNVHRITGDYPTALECFHRALAMNEEVGDRLGVAINTGNIGMIHDITGDYSTALDYYRRALPLHEEIGDRNGVARVTNNIGKVHLSTGDYSLALHHFRQALALHTEMGELQDVAGVTANIIAMYLDMGSDAEAKALLDELDIQKIDDPGVRIGLDEYRAKLQERNGDVDTATEILQRALNEAIAHGLRLESADIHKALRDLALKRSDLAAYVDHNDEYTRITDEINGKETVAKLAKQTKQLEIDAREKEHEKQLAVLHSTLPKHIADRVARGEVVNDHFDNASVLFVDVVGFTSHSSELDATVVVNLLQNIFSSFDVLCAKHDVTKIKTIGDSYMAVAFGTANAEQRTANQIANSEQQIANQIANSEQRIANVALAMMASEFVWPHTGERVMFRIGIHCGPVVAGVLGTERMQYDVWGDTVNVASRMESTSEPGKTQISDVLAHALDENKNSPPDPLSYASLERGSYTVIPRGTVDVKGKGAMQTYWLQTAL